MNGDEGLSIALAMDNAYLAGVKQERERIIKLLEDQLADELYKAIVIGLIIKGENK